MQRVVIVAAATLFVVTGASWLARASEPQWRELFNGYDLSGWEHVGDGQFVVANGSLKTVGGMGLLWYTPEKLGDAVIRVQYKNLNGANSGIFVRIPDAPTEPWMPVNRGYEVQIDGTADDHHVTGTLYSFTKAAARPEIINEWNTLEIWLYDERTVVFVNDVLVTDFTEGDPVPPKVEWFEPDRGMRPSIGFIGIQNHFPEDTVYFRKISVRELGADDDL